MLTVRQDEGGWAAACDDGPEHVSASLHDAIRDAVGHERGEALMLQMRAHETLSAWVAEQALRIEREAGANPPG